MKFLARCAAVVAASVVGMGALSVVTPSMASAATPYPGWVSNEGLNIPNRVWSVDFTIMKYVPNTTFNGKVFDCNGVVLQEIKGNTDTANLNGADIMGSFVIPNGARLPALIKVNYSLSAPGYESYTNVSYFNNPIPNCGSGGSSNAPGTKPRVAVKKWSAKRGVAKVGKKASLTRTYAATRGAKVKYRWYVNGHVVDKDRSFKAKKSWRGKTLTVRVTVSKAGYVNRAKAYSYGRIR